MRMATAQSSLPGLRMGRLAGWRRFGLLKQLGSVAPPAAAARMQAAHHLGATQHIYHYENPGAQCAVASGSTNLLKHRYFSAN